MTTGRKREVHFTSYSVERERKEKAEKGKSSGMTSTPELQGDRSDPYGTRTRVAGVKGRSPRPLDDGAGITTKE